MDEAATRRIVREELAKVLDIEDLAEDDDDRLRLAMTARERMRAIASLPAVGDVQEALAAAEAALKAKGVTG